MILGLERAEEVKNHLEKAGIDPKSISAESKGETEPLAPNSPEKKRARNRRVLIQAYRHIALNLPRLNLIVGTEGNDTIRPTITLMQKTPAKVSGYSFRDSTLLLLWDQPYTINIDAEGYFSESIEFKAPKKDGLSEFTREIILKKAEVLQVLRYEKIHFLSNSAQFAPGAEQDLRKLLQFMRQDTNRYIEIQGHINYALYERPRPQRMVDDHYALSVNRALAVYNYLVKNGINPRRMTYKGLNNSKMLVPNARNGEDAKKNMRVEVLLLKR
jgi:outer membrane protein OmpA-like peptidoglycan-associated protein